MTAGIIFLIIVGAYFFMQKPRDFTYAILLFTILPLFFSSIANAENYVWSYNTASYQVWGNENLYDMIPDYIVNKVNTLQKLQTKG